MAQFSHLMWSSMPAGDWSAISSTEVWNFEHGDCGFEQGGCGFEQGRAGIPTKMFQVLAFQPREVLQPTCGMPFQLFLDQTIVSCEGRRATTCHSRSSRGLAWCAASRCFQLVSLGSTYSPRKDKRENGIGRLKCALLHDQKRVGKDEDEDRSCRCSKCCRSHKNQESPRMI